MGQDGLGVVPRHRAAHPPARRRHPRHHQPLRAAAADQVAGRPGRRGDRRDRRVQRRRTTGCRSSTTWPRRPTCGWPSRWRTSWSPTARPRWRSRRAGCGPRPCSRPTGSTEANWRDATEASRRTSPSPRAPPFVGRAVAALAADPDGARWNGQSLSSGQLAQGLRLHRPRRQPARRVALRRRGPGRRQARRHHRLPLTPAATPCVDLEAVGADRDISLRAQPDWTGASPECRGCSRRRVRGRAAHRDPGHRAGDEHPALVRRCPRARHRRPGPPARPEPQHHPPHRASARGGSPARPGPPDRALPARGRAGRARAAHAATSRGRGGPAAPRGLGRGDGGVRQPRRAPRRRGARRPARCVGPPLAGRAAGRQSCAGAHLGDGQGDAGVVPRPGRGGRRARSSSGAPRRGRSRRGRR